MTIALFHRGETSVVCARCARRSLMPPPPPPAAVAPLPLPPPPTPSEVNTLKQPTCVICIARPRTMITLPCGCLSTCVICAAELDAVPRRNDAVPRGKDCPVCHKRLASGQGFTNTPGWMTTPPPRRCSP